MTPAGPRYGSVWSRPSQHRQHFLNAVKGTPSGTSLSPYAGLTASKGDRT
jgi:hypothetical protein